MHCRLQDARCAWDRKTIEERWEVGVAAMPTARAVGKRTTRAVTQTTNS